MSRTQHWLLATSVSELVEFGHVLSLGVGGLSQAISLLDPPTHEYELYD